MSALKIVHAVELETAELQDVDVEVLGGHLVGVALADIASETYVEAGVAQHVVDQRGRGGLAVAAGDADLLGSVVAARELYFRDDGDAGLQCLAHQRCGVRDAGTLDDLVGAEDFFRGVMTLLVGDAVFLQQGLAFGRDAAVVGEECVETFDFCEDGCSDSALAASECYDAFHGD